MAGYPLPATVIRNKSDLTGEPAEITSQGDYPMIRLSARDGMGIEHTLTP